MSKWSLCCWHLCLWFLCRTQLCEQGGLHCCSFCQRLCKENSLPSLYWAPQVIFPRQSPLEMRLKMEQLCQPSIGHTLNWLSIYIVNMAVLQRHPIPILPLRSRAFSQISRLEAPSGWLSSPCLHLALFFRNPAISRQVKWHKSKHQNLAAEEQPAVVEAAGIQVPALLLHPHSAWPVPVVGLLQHQPTWFRLCFWMIEFSRGHFQETSPKLYRSLRSCLVALWVTAEAWWDKKMSKTQVQQVPELEEPSCICNPSGRRK